MSYRRVITKPDGFAQHAAPQTIAAALRKVRAALTDAHAEERWLIWLAALREREIQEGKWPREDPDDGV